jgi:hypothetical protein
MLRTPAPAEQCCICFEPAPGPPMTHREMSCAVRGLGRVEGWVNGEEKNSNCFDMGVVWCVGVGSQRPRPPTIWRASAAQSQPHAVTSSAGSVDAFPLIRPPLGPVSGLNAAEIGWWRCTGERGWANFPLSRGGGLTADLSPHRRMFVDTKDMRAHHTDRPRIVYRRGPVPCMPPRHAQPHPSGRPAWDVTRRCVMLG